MLHIPNPSHAMGAIYVAWAAWILSWVVAARFSNRTVKRSPWLLPPFLALAAGAYLLSRYLGAAMLMPLWHAPETARWALLVLTLAGFAFAWWARVTLGRLWSGSITLKEGHRIVDSGPYALVRHPIYTGLLLSALATVAAQGSLEAAITGAIVVTGIYIKARIEERFLSGELGADAYGAYRRRVPMLVPFWPK